MTFGNFPLDAISHFPFLNAVFTQMSFFSPRARARLCSGLCYTYLFGHANELNANSLQARFERQLSLLYHFEF